MPRSEDIVDRDLAIFAHGVVNISEIATFLPFLASETKVCKRSKTGNMHSWTLPGIGLQAERNKIQAPKRTECGGLVAAWDESQGSWAEAIWEVVGALCGCSRTSKSKNFMQTCLNMFLSIWTSSQTLLMAFKRPLEPRRHPLSTTVATVMHYASIPVLGLNFCSIQFSMRFPLLFLLFFLFDLIVLFFLFVLFELSFLCWVLLSIFVFFLLGSFTRTFLFSFLCWVLFFFFNLFIFFLSFYFVVAFRFNFRIVPYCIVVVLSIY
jgi:hypothetical protein